MNNNNYTYKKIRENILQIADEQGVYVTLVKGKELAILWDTGYGIRDLRSFVENNITTPYIVINSHGHPDHSMGNYMFDEIYIYEADLALMKEYNTRKCRKDILENELKNFEINEDEKELFLTRKLPQIKVIEVGQIFDLGGVHAKVIAMPGHSDYEFPKAYLNAHIKNIENISVDESTKQIIFGIETYTSAYGDAEGKSSIVFSKDKL